MPLDNLLDGEASFFKQIVPLLLGALLAVAHHLQESTEPEYHPLKYAGAEVV